MSVLRKGTLSRQWRYRRAPAPLERSEQQHEPAWPWCTPVQLGLANIQPSTILKVRHTNGASMIQVASAKLGGLRFRRMHTGCADTHPTGSVGCSGKLRTCASLQRSHMMVH